MNILQRNEAGYLCYQDADNNETIRVPHWQALEDGKTYIVKSKSINAKKFETRKERVDFDVLEQEATLAVKIELGPSAHCHYDVKTRRPDGTLENQYDGLVQLVHNGDEDIANSEIYVLECAYSPTEEKISRLIKKCKNAEISLPKEPHFATATKFIPVLGGRLMTEGIETICKQRGIWTVKPNGAGYSVTRNFHTVRNIRNGIVWALKKL